MILSYRKIFLLSVQIMVMLELVLYTPTTVSFIAEAISLLRRIFIMGVDYAIFTINGTKYEER